MCKLFKVAYVCKLFRVAYMCKQFRVAYKQDIPCAVSAEHRSSVFFFYRSLLNTCVNCPLPMLPVQNKSIIISSLFLLLVVV